MPFPNVETQWKPGQSGNPGGHSKGRRIETAVLKLLDEGDTAHDLGVVVILKAIGRLDKLGDRKPDLDWMKFLHSIVDGPIDPRPVAEVAPTAETDEPKRIVIPDVDDRHTPRED